MVPQKQWPSGSSLSVSYKSAAFLDNIFNTLPETVTVTDPNFVITGFNAAAEALYGVPLSEAKGKVLFELVKFDISGATLLDAITQLFNKGSWKGDISFHRYDGQELFLETKATLIRDDKGNTSAIVLTSRNITEEKHAARKLMQAENKYKSVVDSLLEGVMLINADGSIDTINPRAASILGLTEGEIKASSINNLVAKAVNEDGLPIIKKDLPIARTFATGIACNNTVLGIQNSAQGYTWLLVNTSPVFRDNTEKPAAVIVTFQDITRQKREDIEREENEVLFKTFFHESTTGCFIYDEDGYVVMGNPEFNRSTLFPGGTAGRHVKEIFSPDFAAIILERNRRFLAEHEQLSLTSTMTRPDGNESTYHITLYKICIPGRKRMIACQAIDVTEEKKASRKLEESELLFSSFVNNSQSPCWIYDENGKVILANQSYSKLTAHPEGVSGKYIDELFPEELARKLLQRNRDFLAQPDPLISANEVPLADGTKKHFVSYLYHINIPGQKTLIGGQAIDITEEKQVQERLQQTEMLFSTFMKNSAALAWIYAPDGTFLYGNPEFMGRVGRDESAAGRKIEEITDSAFVIDMVYDKIRQLRDKEVVLCEDNFTDADGGPLDYLSYWFRLPQPDGSYLVGGQAFDITEKKKSRRLIEKMNERFTYAVNAISDAVWDIDLQTNEIFRSDNFSNISGYSKEEIEPTLEWWYDRIHPDDRDRVKQNSLQFFSNGVSRWQDEYRFRYADGSWRHLVDTGYSIIENGVPVRAIGAIQDITERKRLEEELLKEHLQRQKQIGKASIDAQERERNTISAELHDNVNQLLMSARLHIGVAKRGGDDQEKLLDKASDYLLMAVEEIRALSKKLNTSIVERSGLEACISEICENLSYINHVETEVIIDPEIISKLSNDRQLMVFRIVQEQTNNIIKYAEASRAMIILEERNNECRLCISDNGKGFDKDVQKASGVGLINIFSRADAYNGRVKIDSSPGKGCTVEVIFPFTN